MHRRNQIQISPEFGNDLPKVAWKGQLMTVATLTVFPCYFRSWDCSKTMRASWRCFPRVPDSMRTLWQTNLCGFASQVSLLQGPEGKLFMAHSLEENIGQKVINSLPPATLTQIFPLCWRPQSPMLHRLKHIWNLEKSLYMPKIIIENVF